MTQEPYGNPGGPPPVFPGALPTPHWEPSPGGGFTIGGAITLGWEALRARYGFLLGASLVAVLIYLGAGSVPFIGPFLAFFVSPLFVSLAYMNARVIRREQPEWGSFFSDLGPKYWWVLLQQLLIAVAGLIASLVIVVPIGLAAGLAGASRAGPEILVVLVPACIALGLVIAYFQVRFGFAGMLFLEAPPGRLDIIEAFKLSWRLTAPVGWRLLFLGIVLGLIAAASFFALCVGLFLLGIPLYFAATAAAYTAVCSGPSTGLCPNCGYDCRATNARICPECGARQPG